MAELAADGLRNRDSSKQHSCARKAAGNPLSGSEAGRGMGARVRRRPEDGGGGLVVFLLVYNRYVANAILDHDSIALSRQTRHTVDAHTVALVEGNSECE